MEDLSQLEIYRKTGLPMPNVISDSASKSNGRRYSFRPGARAAQSLRSSFRPAWRFGCEAFSAVARERSWAGEASRASGAGKDGHLANQSQLRQCIPKQFVLPNRQVYAVGDATAISHIEGTDGRNDFSVDGCTRLLRRLHVARLCELRFHPCFFGSGKYSRAGEVGADGGDGKLPPPLGR